MKRGCQQGLQPGPISIAVMYNLLSGHDAEKLVVAGVPGLDKMGVRGYRRIKRSRFA